MPVAIGQRLRALGIGIVVLSAVPLQGHAQQPTPRDTTTPRIRISPPPVPVRSPMVFALVSDSLLPDSTLGRAKQVAESLGFGFAVKGAAHFSIVDSRYQAIYYVPANVSRGYLIVIPGHRPDMVRGVVAADSLRHRIEHYRVSAGLPLKAPPPKCC